MRYIVHFSHQVTRRKRVHYITDIFGELVYVSSRADEVWRWLHDQRAERIEVRAGQLQMHVIVAQRDEG